jgi:ribose/xylose/arabinose/galactoside ABC-type transport system permease subunit
MGITPIIVTLGSLYFARGMAFILGDGRAVVSGLPPDFIVPARTFVGPIPTPVIVAAVVVTTFWVLLHRSLLGKYTYAIGGNRETAVLSGLAVGRVQGGLYVLSGLTAGIAGVILASRLGSGQPDAGVGFEFEVIVAIILGGTSLAGGQGTIVGTVLGALIVAVLGNGLNLLGVQTFYQYLVQGAALIVAVLLDQNLKRRAQAGGLRIGRPRSQPPAGASTAGG